MASPTMESWLSQPVPDHLFHYTQHGGLKGIVGERKLRATEVRYQNDGRELIHAAELAVDTGKKHKLDRVVIDFVETFMDTTVRAYVASFTEQGDDLSQWRGYGEAGSGYSLRLNGPLLKSVAENRERDRSWVLGRVCYEPATQQEIVEEWIVKAVENWEEVGWDDGPPFPPAGFQLVKELMSYGTLLKHKSFVEECEWRIISPLDMGYIPDPEFQETISFREGRNCLIPYVDFDLSQCMSGAGGSSWSTWPLENVRVGPGPQADLRKRSADMLIEKCGHHGNVTVDASEIPWRGLV